MEHIPVLEEEILNILNDHPPKYYLDGTFGRGGHARSIMQKFPDVVVAATDQDHEAIEFAKENFSEEINNKKLFLYHTNFADIAEIKPKFLMDLGVDKFDVILLDLGVSSPQLDQPERGFSFYNEGPLDMRMDVRSEVTAADIVNTWDEDELVELFQTLGEVYKPFRVVKAIVHDRKETPFQTTRDLAGLIERIEGWRKKGQHPATKYFLALRLRVNKELDVVESVIPEMIDLLNHEGLLLIITFHSLEDRIVKYKFKELKTLGELVNKKVIQAKWDEKKHNPRSRSAKLRVFRRLIET